MTRLAAKVLMRAALAMFILCIGCRFIIRTEAGMMGDNLAIIASLALMVVAMLYLRFAPQDEADRARAQKAGGITGSESPPRSDTTTE